jgi:hypothetical protein
MLYSDWGCAAAPPQPVSMAVMLPYTNEKDGSCMIEPIPCPNCGTMLGARSSSIITTHSFDTCLRRCDDCGIGFSNAKTDPTMIYRYPVQNVPDRLSENVELVLQNAFNIRNRVNKKSKFCFSTSEDALTWTFFRHLQIEGQLSNLINVIGEKFDGSPSLYLWGVSPSAPVAQSAFTSKLSEVSDYFGEKPESRSEPDVIIHIPDQLLVFIEVKLFSSNEISHDETKFAPYLSGGEKYYSDPQRALDSRHYELVRNWSIGSKLAGAEKFVLVNLAPENVFHNQWEKLLNDFELSLNQISDKQIFVRFTWENLLNSQLPIDPAIKVEAKRKLRF